MSQNQVDCITKSEIQDLFTEAVHNEIKNVIQKSISKSVGEVTQALSALEIKLDKYTAGIHSRLDTMNELGIEEEEVDDADIDDGYVHAERGRASPYFDEFEEFERA